VCFASFFGGIEAAVAAVVGGRRDWSALVASFLGEGSALGLMWRASFSGFCGFGILEFSQGCSPAWLVAFFWLSFANRMSVLSVRGLEDFGCPVAEAAKVGGDGSGSHTERSPRESR
jgi:hypothetical protein